MRMTKAAVQKEAFPLAGLLVNVMVQNLKEPVISRPITGSENLTKPDAVESFSTIKRKGGINCLAGAQGEFACTLESVVNSTRGEFKDTLRRFATSTRTGSIEFSESIKKGSTANATLTTTANGYQPFGSMPRLSSSRRNKRFIHPERLSSPSSCIAIDSRSYNSESKRNCTANRSFLLSLVDMVNHPGVSFSQVDNVYQRQQKQNPVSADTPTGHLTTTVNTTNEVAIMDITTPPQGRESFGLNSGHQHRHFVWIIAAVRRDNPELSPVLHHIAAENEREARRTLTKDNVCFFAGRLNIAATGVNHA